MSDPDYTGTCECGKLYPQGNGNNGNCAHLLSEWMIKKGYITKNPKGSTPEGRCPAGREIKAKEMRKVFENMGLKRQFNPPVKIITKNDGTKVRVTQPCFIYCEHNTRHIGHVYYGKKDECIAGTDDGRWAEYFEFYY